MSAPEITNLWQGSPQQLIVKVKKILKTKAPKAGFHKIFTHHQNKKHAEIAVAWAEECIGASCKTVYLVDKNGQYLLSANNDHLFN